jgi:hypothetical protein
MYQARPKIIAMTDGRPLADSYFTQVLLPDLRLIWRMRQVRQWVSVWALRRP